MHEQQGRCSNSSSETGEKEDISRRKFGIEEDFNRDGKLMRRSLWIFIYVEYDAGASLHLITGQPDSMTGAHSRKGEVSPSHFGL
jgi:hypothetical protein